MSTTTATKNKSRYRISSSLQIGGGDDAQQHLQQRSRRTVRKRRLHHYYDTSCSSFFFLVLLLLFLLLSLTSVFAFKHNDNNNNHEQQQQQQETLQPLLLQDQQQPIDYLDDNSVVLITGIAGFIGSELAMALKRVYKPRKIIGIDSMDDGFGGGGSGSGSGSGQGRSPEELGIYDFKRQRLFHVLQTINSSSGNSDIGSGDAQSSSTTCHFYRVDFRPNIPDYQDLGEVPVLDHIFVEHPDITHVVHLADPYGVPSILLEGGANKLTTQAVPRVGEQIKSGMMEALLEQLTKAGKLHPTGRVPHFTFASSSHVYNHHYHNHGDRDQQQLNPPPFQEDKPITTPSSIHGASKLIDEILAKTYHETRNIYSVGLRFFDVYGPWMSPGTFLFDLAERAIQQSSSSSSSGSVGGGGGEFGGPPDDYSELLKNLMGDNDKDDDNSESSTTTVSRDYIYIDDAVDAIMAAMQFRPLTTTTKTPPAGGGRGGGAAGKSREADSEQIVVQPAPVFINVGTGQTTSVRKIVQTMQKFVMINNNNNNVPPPPPRPKPDMSSSKSRRSSSSISYASTTRAKQLLGFESRIPLEEGIFHLLAWHHDRAFPYGSPSLDDDDNEEDSPPSPRMSSSNTNTKQHQQQQQHPLETMGMVACSPLDAECLKGAPVFPCASECSNRHQCTPSFYDSVVALTRKWTEPCDAVLYTVDLDEDLSAIPSASATVSTTSQSHVIVEGGGGGQCNLAFVSSSSPLVREHPQYYDAHSQQQQKQRRRRQQQQQQGGDEDMNSNNSNHQNPPLVLKHGFWTLVLVDVTNQDEKDFFLEFLPKLSPGHFFGGTKTRRIIYCDPDVIIDSIPNLLAEAAMQPKYQLYQQQQGHEQEEQGEDDQNSSKDDNTSKNNDDATSSSASREGATAMLIGKGRQSQRSRKGQTPLQEAVQDMAYRSVRISVIDQMSGDGFALPLDSSFIVHTLQSEDSRLFRCDVFGELIQWGVGTDQSAFEFILELHDMWSSVIAKKAGLKPWWVGEGVVTIPELHQPLPGSGGGDEFGAAGISQKRRLLEALTDNSGAGGGPRAAQLVKVEKENEVDEAKDGDEANGGSPDGVVSVSENLGSQPAKRDGNFGDGDDQVGEEQAQGDGGAEVIAARNEEDKNDDIVDDDTNEEEEGNLPSPPEVHGQERDISAYDTWMGVLSSTPLQYFVRIVPSTEAGVVVLDDYEF